MNDWKDYIEYYKTEYPRITEGEQGLLFLILCLTVGSPLFIIIPRKFWVLVPICIVALYSTLVHRPRLLRMSIADGGKTLIINNRGSRNQWLNVILEFISRLLDPAPDPLATNIKRVGCFRLNISNKETQYTVPTNRFLGTIPRRQIILTNHTVDPFSDAMSPFPIVPVTSKLIIVQQHYNSIINGLSRRLWGAWTVNKDDKTPDGRRRTCREMDKLLGVMKRENDLTVVFFGTGIVPKTVSQCRTPERVYPGAVYMSLLSGYPITLLINDLSSDGVFRSVVKEPWDLRLEYSSQIRLRDDVESFRTDKENEKVIKEICEQLRIVSREEYDRITKIENGRPGYRKRNSPHNHRV